MTRYNLVFPVADVRITAAEEMMRVNKIHSIIVVDDAGAVAGVVEFFNVSVLG